MNCFTAHRQLDIHSGRYLGIVHADVDRIVKEEPPTDTSLAAFQWSMDTASGTDTEIVTCLVKTTSTENRIPKPKLMLSQWIFERARKCFASISV